MKLSIVILTCNQKELTIRCLDSLKDLFPNQNVEIILVDNGSTDSTIEEISKRFPKVIIIKNDKNLGVAAGRNIGLRKARGKYLMILDNDTIANPETVMFLVDYLDSHPEYGLVAPLLTDKNNRVQRSYKDFPSIALKVKNWLKGRRNDEFVLENPTFPIEPFYVIGAAQVFSAELYHSIGGFDEKIFFGPEDADFCIKVRDSGKKVIYLPSHKIIHDWQRSTTGKLFNKRVFLHIKGLLYFYWKHKRFF